MITKLIRNAWKLVLPATLALLAYGQTPEAAIREVLDKQSVAWNKGDLETFVSFYDKDATFVGETVTRGPAQLLERYKKRYSTRDRMGKLTFSDNEIRMLGPANALVVGKWHLDRGQAGGGPVGGIYSLVFVKTQSGWRILHDHTT